MKKTLLSVCLVMGAIVSQAQVTTYVLQPPALEGAQTFTWADNWGLTPDLNDPANTVQGFAEFVDDGTAADSLGCNPLLNDLTGKIAVGYRGACQFGIKALKAQNAGAIAYVIINNQGEPVGMAAGDSGGLVTIPVVMISTTAGGNLRNEINAGNVELLIGSVQGIFEYNLHVSRALALMPAQSATPKWLAADNTEFDADLGSWMKNFGSQPQTGITLTGVVTQDGSEIYNQTSDPADLNPGDSVFFQLPLFTQPTYSGFYQFTYTVNTPNVDNFPSDDSFGFTMLIDSVFAYAPMDQTTKLTIPGPHYRPSGGVGNFSNCVHFRSPNADRVKVEGLYGSAAKTGSASLDGEAIEARIYEWNDSFVDLSVAPTYTGIAQVESADYFYSADIPNANVYIPFATPYVLENNIRYLFCVTAGSDSIFLGYNESVDYTKTQDNILQPISVVGDNGAWNANGFGADVVSAVCVKMSSTAVGINETNRLEVSPYPNPTNAMLSIPLAGQSGAANLQVYDQAGKMVVQRKVSVSNGGVLTMDVKDIANGTYTFNMNFENGKYANFRVVVTK